MEWITYYTGLDDMEEYGRHGITTLLLAPKNLASRAPKLSDWQEIEAAASAGKKLGMKIGILLNRIFFDEELNALDSALKRIKKLGFDRIEYTDPAVFIRARELGLHTLCSYNPDTLLCNSADVQFYLDLGLNDVVLSKEITLEEMTKILQTVKGQGEVTLFGRLVMSYSKRALLSAYSDEIGRDQTLRGKEDLVLIETTRTGRMPIVEDDAGTTIYTDYTLAAYPELLELVQSGADRFRFENRFLKKTEFLDCLDGFGQVLQGADGEAVLETLRQRYPHLALSEGYMHQKTNLVK